VTTLPIIHTPGDHGNAGFLHGRAVYDIFEPAFVRNYLDHLSDAIGFTLDDLEQQASAWMDALPHHFQDEIVGMAHGAGVPIGTVCEVLYADIARPSRGPGEPRTTTDRVVSSGPMCSALIATLDDGRPWLGRNCDWLTPTLLRGTAGVVHRAPNRIPSIGVGIRGDVDIDTGMNAEGLWLHLHTVHAADPEPEDREVISWLFWAREALETCATIDEVGSFVARTGRDKGVLAICLEGRTGLAAVFECGRGTHTRHDLDLGSLRGPACLTNHSPSKPHDESAPWRGPGGGTIGRYRALRATVRETPPRTGPDDLVRTLAREGVEMRTPRWLRTIYSCVVEPRARALWFADGRADGTPAASGGRWSRVHWDW